MFVNDLVSDSITRIRNAQRAGKGGVLVLKSKMILALLGVLLEEGYIRSFSEVESSSYPKFLKVDLKYYRDSPVISEITRVSKPGCRFYTSIANLKEMYGGLGISVLSTSAGVVSDRMARKLGLGGEVLCRVF
ncbi:30S ribosomal protein S8 [Candidatus Cyrtobacter comes]|uniref:Small ribosomal subunit protein uS8 n=1 Tax=Candidatus Cyrtobacter comes TaxID=675776 RepID=A0ABU5L6I3_9RICK|nr:30S ribosomal protein S8 [Candidatus Cyrtobacter comes]MDZ5761736.1 30S ribosomal protein S8 [Candidatus Cyrtobacter comes]